MIASDTNNTFSSHETLEPQDVVIDLIMPLCVSLKGPKKVPKYLQILKNYQVHHSYIYIYKLDEMLDHVNSRFLGYLFMETSTPNKRAMLHTIHFEHKKSQSKAYGP